MKNLIFAIGRFATDFLKQWPTSSGLFKTSGLLEQLKMSTLWKLI